MTLKTLNDDELISETKCAVEIETSATSEVISCFQEIYDRKLYLARGYSSLFEMVTQVFKYCPGSAQLRINAMRLIQDVPAVKEKIESGEMSLTVAANVQSFLYREKKSNRAYSTNAKIELIETCAGKSVLDVQKEFVRRSPEIEKREVVRPTSEDRLRVSHSISVELEEKLKRIRLLWSHVDPDMSREDLLNRMAELTLNQIDPVRRAERAKKRLSKKNGKTENSLHVDEVAKTGIEAALESTKLSTEEALLHSSEVKPRTRSLKSKTLKSVWDENRKGGCCFEDPATGHRCGSQFQLQIDHIKPYSEGGSNEPENLRVVCATHNRFVWTRRSGSRVTANRLEHG